MRMIRKRYQSARSAFTLIELLVVVAIIALLISILIPSLHRARIQSKTVKCAAQLHDIGVGLTTYYNEHNRFPHQNSIGPASVTTRLEREGAGFWSYSVHEYIAEAMGGLEFNSDMTERTRAHAVFYCPFVAPEEMDTNETEFSNVLCGPGTGNPIENSEEKYMHITYVYPGNLQECVNDPAQTDPNTMPAYVDELTRSEIAKKRRSYVGRDGDARHVLMLDTVMQWRGGGKWRINHGAGWQTPATEYPLKFNGANLLYGDGHVTQEKANYFKEMWLGPTWATANRTACLRFGMDSIWW